MLIASLVLSHGDDVPTQSAPLPPHTILEFGTLGGATAAFNDIHEYGTFIVGESRTASGATRAAVVRDGTLRDLGTLGGASSTTFAVSGGLFVGQSQTASGQTHAFRYDLWSPSGNVMTDLGTLGGTRSRSTAPG